MSDELSFLRWCYHNAARFTRQKMSGAVPDREALQKAYEVETGNVVPSDYRIIA